MQSIALTSEQRLLLQSMSYESSSAGQLTVQRVAMVMSVPAEKCPLFHYHALYQSYSHLTLNIESKLTNFPIIDIIRICQHSAVQPWICTNKLYCKMCLLSTSEVNDNILTNNGLYLSLDNVDELFIHQHSF